MICALPIELLLQNNKHKMRGVSLYPLITLRPLAATFGNEHWPSAQERCAEHSFVSRHFSILCFVVRMKGFEPPTPNLKDWCSANWTTPSKISLRPPLFGFTPQSEHFKTCPRMHSDSGEPLLRFLHVSIRLVWEYPGGNFCGFVLKSHASGWDSWIRTNGMMESKSIALPLGDIPIKIDRHLIFYLQTISRRSLCIQVVGSYLRNTESYHKSQIHSGNPASECWPI